MSGLNDLAKKFDSLADVPRAAVVAAVPRIRQRILEAGRPGGALQKGNAAVLSVTANGTSITATRVGLYGPNAKAWMSSVEDEISAGFKKILG